MKEIAFLVDKTYENEPKGIKYPNNFKTIEQLKHFVKLNASVRVIDLFLSLVISEVYCFVKLLVNVVQV